MKKKAYMTPQMEVVEIKFEPQLLAGSATGVLDEPAGDDVPGLAPGLDSDFDQLNPFAL